MENSKQQIWYTGDWKTSPNTQVPYNGVKVIANLNYVQATSSPTIHKLVSVSAEVIDYTYNINGVSSKVELLKPGIWYTILIPENNQTSPPRPSTEFTIRGVNTNNLGRLKLEVTSSGIYFNIEFRYGINGRTREEIGYIMKFKETYTEEQDPIYIYEGE